VSHSYQVLGTSIPSLLGRKRLLDQINRHLLKPTPDHVQAVGPSLYGKSVLLSHLASSHQDGSPTYLTAAYSDLRHAPPTSDADFVQRFASVVKQALTRIGSTLAEVIDLGSPNVQELLVLVFDELERNDARVLIVLDGFDHVLEGTGLTRNLWDQLRALGQKNSLRLVTGSRRPLRELCKSEDSRTSDFWEIFYDKPIYVGPFDESDWEDLITPLSSAGVDVDASAQKELGNWTGGVPVLAVAVLERLTEKCERSRICSKSDVDEISVAVLDERRQLMAQIWDGCDVDVRGDLVILAEKESEGIAVSDLADSRTRQLVERGFGAVRGNRIRSACRIMARYAVRQAPAIADLKRLFGTEHAFVDNIRGLLEYRLGQIAERKIDPELFGLLYKAVRELEPKAELALMWVRSISNRALDLIWRAELPPNRRIPDEWVSEWKNSGERLLWLETDQRLPSRQGSQCNVLRLLTGAERVRPLAKYATKPTALLLDSLQSIGDFGQHRADFPESTVTTGFAATVVMTAIELAASIAADLARQPAQR
jgi:hypothetical protein